MNWTPSKRFYAALCGEKPDRVPTLPKIWVDLAARLRSTGLRDVIEDAELAMRIIVDAALDVRADGARLFHFASRRTRTENGALVEVDKSGRVRGPIDTQGGLATRLLSNDDLDLEDPYDVAFVQFFSPPEPAVKTVADARRIAVPEKSFYEELGIGRWQRDLLQSAGEKIALLGDCASATLAFVVLVRQMNNTLTDVIDQPDLVHAIMEKGEAIAIEKGKFNIDCGLKMLRLNDSVANMSVISPAVWRRFVLPHMKTVCDELHGYSPGVKIYCHICGNVIPVMHDVLEAGVDCIGPLDPIGGVTCAAARQTVGEGVPLMGGVHTLSFVNSTPDELLEEARTCIEGAGRNGAYILGSGCVVPRATRRENLLALARAAELNSEG